MSYEADSLPGRTEELLRQWDAGEIDRIQITREIRSLTKEVEELRGRLGHADQKRRHGCTDAYCKECDGSMDNLNPQSEMFQIQQLMRAKESSDAPRPRRPELPPLVVDVEETVLDLLKARNDEISEEERQNWLGD